MWFGIYLANPRLDLNLCILQLSTNKKKTDDLVLPPKLRLCLLFIPEFKSSSSSSSWVGDRTPASQPIMAGTFSRRNGGKTPATHSQIFRVEKLQCRRTHRWSAGEMHQVIPKLWAFSMKQCTMAAWSLRRFSVLAFIFSVPSPKWRRLGAKITDKLLLSILFSALLRLSRKNSSNVYVKTTVKRLIKTSLMALKDGC